MFHHFFMSFIISSVIQARIEGRWNGWIFTPLFLSPLLSFFFFFPQILIGSLTLLQKFTPHFKILYPLLLFETVQDLSQNQTMVGRSLRPLQGLSWSRYSHIVSGFFHLKESNMRVTWAILDHKMFMSVFTYEKNDKSPTSLRATLKDNFITF